MSTKIFVVEAGFGKGSQFTWDEGLAYMKKVTEGFTIVSSSDITFKKAPGKGGLYTYLEMLCEVEDIDDSDNQTDTGDELAGSSS